MHWRRHIHVALSALQSVCGALMCFLSRMRRPDTAALKRVIIFLGLPPKEKKKVTFLQVTSLQFDKSHFIALGGCWSPAEGAGGRRAICGRGWGGGAACQQRLGPRRLNDAPRQQIQLPSPLAFNFSLILHTVATAAW